VLLSSRRRAKRSAKLSPAALKGLRHLFEAEGRQLTLTEPSLALSTLPRLLADQGGEQVAAVADLFTSFRVFDVNVERARRPAGGGGGGEEERLQHDASNLAPFLRYLHDVHAASFAQLCEDARHFVPGLRDVVVASASGADRGWQIELVEGGLRDATPHARASFGTVRALALLALLHDPHPPKLTCVEEIDHGLHP
jgi:predicted ATPase